MRLYSHAAITYAPSRKTMLDERALPFGFGVHFNSESRYGQQWRPLAPLRRQPHQVGGALLMPACWSPARFRPRCHTELPLPQGRPLLKCPGLDEFLDVVLGYAPVRERTARVLAKTRMRSWR